VARPAPGHEGWQPLPSPGGWADVQFVRTTGTTLWAGAFARGGLFRSTDGGETWVPSDGGLGTAHAFDILALEGALYAATDEGLFRSSDGGQQWVLDPCASGERLYGLAHWQDQLWLAGERGMGQCPSEAGTPPAVLDPGKGAPLLKLLAMEDELYAAGADGVWQGQGQDGEVRWTQLPTPPGDGFVQDLFALPRPQGHSRLIARHEEHLWQWAGGRWTAFGPDGEGLAVAASSDGTWWLAGPGNRLLHSRDSGVTWEAATVPDLLNSRHLFPLPDGSLLVAGQWRLWRLEGEDRWSAIGPPLGRPAVTALVRHPDVPATWIAGTVGGIYQSSDAGETWQAISPPWVVRDLAWGSEGRLYAAHDEGIAVWREGQWTEGQGPWPSIRYFAISPDPAQPGWAMAGSWGNNLLWTTDGGQTWEPVHGELVTLSIYSILRDPPPGKGLLAGAVERLFHSPNGRDGWVALTPPNPGRTTFALLRDGQGTLWAGTTDGLYCSRDGGATWQAAPLGQPATIIHLSAQGDVLWAGSEGHGLFRSRDGGQSWEWLGPAGATVYDLLATERGLVAATAGGLMLLQQAERQDQS